VGRALPDDVRELDVDFYAFSGHKLFGPTGIGVLYGREKLLDAMPPYQGGGDMIKSVTFAKTEYADLPNRFEAGTPHIAGAVGLGAAIDYVTSVGLANAGAARAGTASRTRRSALAKCPGLRIIGNAAKKASVISFVHGKPADRIARHRRDPRYAQHRGAHRASLLPARDGSVRDLVDDTDVAGDVQHGAAATSTRRSRILKQAGGRHRQPRSKPSAQIDYPQGDCADAGRRRRRSSPRCSSFSATIRTPKVCS
jgi:kynureninase